MVLAVPESSPRPGALVVCPTPIGNLGDVTLRVLDELRSRRRDRLRGHPPHRDPARAATGSRSPLLSLHEHNEDARAASWSSAIRAGERVALVSDAGMPPVSDPGARLVAAVLDAGLDR